MDLNAYTEPKFPEPWKVGQSQVWMVSPYSCREMDLNAKTEPKYNKVTEPLDIEPQVTVGYR